MSDREDVLADLAAYGRLLQQLTPVGVPWPPPGAAAPTIAAIMDDAMPSPAEDEVLAAPGPTEAGAGEGEAGLASIRDTMGDCRRCKLAGGRKTIVFGQGDPRAELMFVGEAPGADEDEQGLAFVGRAGQLLTDIIEKGMKMKRSEVFIANVIKCRPPQNRNPEPDEIMACQPFLEAQIRAIRPKVLVGLGKFGAQWLLKTAAPITKIRGTFGSYEGIAVMPTYHPAYLLRNPAGKKDVWEDMKQVLALLGRPIA
ncbi:MAG: uracil-DNA glycosylase [Vicinamibacteria bacterium]